MPVSSHTIPPTRRGRFWSGWGASTVLGSVLFIAVLLPPFLSVEARHFVMAAFSALCHQIPERSPFVNGVQLAVCHRCVGIYAALAAAPLAFLVFRRWDGVINRHARWLVLAAILVPGVDWLGDLVNLWANTPVTRGLTGGVFGMTVGYFLCRAFVELADPEGKVARREGRISGQPNAMPSG